MGVRAAREDVLVEPGARRLLGHVIHKGSSFFTRKELEEPPVKTRGIFVPIVK